MPSSSSSAVGQGHGSRIDQLHNVAAAEVQQTRTFTLPTPGTRRLDLKDAELLPKSARSPASSFSSVRTVKFGSELQHLPVVPGGTRTA